MMTSRQETFYTARLPPTTPDDVNRRASVDSVSSAADRRRWRNHDHVLTPEPQTVEHDPFEELFGNLPPPVTRRRSADETTSDESEVGEEEGKEEVESRVPDQSQGVREGPVPRGGLNGNAIGLDDDANPSEEKKDDASRSQNPAALADDDRRHAKLRWRERIRHFTWTWFCLTMATGGLANVLYAVPFRFQGLYALGCVFFIGNMVLFLFNVAMISCRFYFYPRTFRASFLHPTESLFIPAATVSFGIIMMNISQYGVGEVGGQRWLQHVMIVLFWVDCGLAITLSVLIYLIMFVFPFSLVLLVVAGALVTTLISPASYLIEPPPPLTSR
jgi:hypothetical protein